MATLLKKKSARHVEKANTDRPLQPQNQDDVGDFAVTVLAALRSMASRNRHAEADLFAVLRGAGVIADRPKVVAAVNLLHAEGCVSHLIPLGGGGLLLRVTGATLERSVPQPTHWPVGVAR